MMLDPDRTEVTIGDTIYSVPPMSFYVLKRIWPYVQTIADNPDRIAMTDAALHLLCDAMELSEVAPLVSFDDAERALRPAQMDSVIAAATALLRNSGLITPEGEAVAASLIPASQRGNGIDSSPNLSPTE
ncbi:MAG TPA: hypothetical protein VMU08_04860 [Rhizomicrobium sp.]|nr:hypothetical protein [Rhizomicrobium sp.]